MKYSGSFLSLDWAGYDSLGQHPEKRGRKKDEALKGRFKRDYSAASRWEGLHRGRFGVPLQLVRKCI